MTTTRAHIEAMTDVGVFERLVTAVLRKAEPSAAALIHSGVNADGRPIAGPVDGFAVYDDGENFLACAHTTMALSRLEAKWLNTDDGDIVKAARTASAADFSKRRLILSTNHEPQPDLVVAARNAARNGNLVCDFWTASRLADFLDDDAEGQWIRRRFFGVSAVRLSRSHLEDIAVTGPVDIPIFDAPAALASRSASARLVEQFEGGGSAILLAAASGQGKTIIARQVWSQMAELGAGAVHVAHEDVDASVNLAQALTRALQRRASDLSERCGGEAERLAAMGGLLVLIEDINHSPRPEEALRKVIGWMRARPPGLSILCPIWPRALARLPDQERREVGNLTVWLDLPDAEEALALARARATAQGVQRSDHELRQIVRRLGCDPLLIGLTDFSADAADGVSAYIQREAERVAAATGHGASEVLEAIEALGEAIVRHRVLAPPWSQVRAWLTIDHLGHIRTLAQNGAILRLVGAGHSEALAFRHDRVRDEIRALGLRRVLVSSDQDVSTDPHYAELWGLVLADPSCDKALMELAAERNPLGLFYALPECAGRSDVRRRELADRAGRWLTTAPKTHQRLRWACQFAIREFEAPEAVPLLACFEERSWMIVEALCLNGNWEACVRIASMWSALEPQAHDLQLFSHLQSRRGRALLVAIKAELARVELSDETVSAILGVAGRLRAQGLEDALQDIWRRRRKTSSFVAAMLWTSAICAPALVPSILSAWGRLSNRKTKSYRTPRYKVLESVRDGFWIMEPESALPALTARSHDPRDVLFWSLAPIFEGWDHPDAQEFTVRHFAAAQAEADRKGSWYIGLTHIGEPWRKDSYRNGRSMSAASLRRLQDLWTDPDEDEEVRRFAMRIWGTATPKRLAPLARAIDPLDSIGAEAVRARLELEDPTVADDFHQLLKTDLQHNILWQHVRGHWQPSLLPLLEWTLDRRRQLSAETVDRLLGDFALPTVMMELNEADRDRLLLEHWNQLGQDSRWVHLALWTATPASTELARSTLDAGDTQELLKYVSHHYGLQRRDHPAAAELRRLQALEPYLGLLAQSDLNQIADCCDRNGWRDWRIAHLDNLMMDGDYVNYRTRDKRWAVFDGAVQKGDRTPPLDFLLDRMVERVDSATVLSDADAWVRHKPSIDTIRIGCGVVVELGAREELKVLEAWANMGVDGTNDLIEDAAFALRRRSLT